MYKCIIFDIDGTILDTEFAVLSSLKKLAKEELHKDFSFEELRFALGIPGEVTLKKLGISNTMEAEKTWNLYLKDYFTHVKVFDKIEETLIELNKIGATIGLVTSKTKQEFSDDFVPFGITNYFSFVVCADDTEKHKPDPEPLLKFIELSGINQSDSIYVGDTEYDMECAFRAGMDFALALWGAKTPTGMHANYFLKEPTQILQLAKA